MSRKHFKSRFADNMKKTGVNGYVYDFSVDYDAIVVDDILGIHNYLMKKNGIVQNVWIFQESIFYSNVSF